MVFVSDKRLVTTFTYTILLLFFFQLLTDFVAGIYAYGVLGTGLPAEMALVVLFAAPFVHLILGRRPPPLLLIVLAELLIIGRAVEIFLPTRGQLVVAGLGTALFLYIFPALIWERGQKRDRAFGRQMGLALLLAVAVSITLHTLGSSMDLSNVGMFRALAWMMALPAAVFIPLAFRYEAKEVLDDRPAPPRSGRVVMLMAGLSGIFLLVYSAFASPMVIASWTRTDYRLVVGATALVIVIYAWLVPGNRFRRSGWKFVLGANVIFALALTLTLAANQFSLPDDPAVYPLLEPATKPVATLALAIMLALFPILFLDFEGLIGEIVFTGPSLRQVGLGFGLAALLMLFLILAHVFTSAWAYVDPALEPLFHNRFWQVHFIAGLAIILAMVVMGNRKRAEDRHGRNNPLIVAGLVTVLGLVTILGIVLLAPDPADPPSPATLRVAGYNLQQGYDVDGQRSHHEQCKVLKEIDADIVGLTESDTARIAGGNFDIVHFLAACLDMYAYAGPRTGAGTFGYALLSRFPIEDPETIHLLSGPGLASADDPEESTDGDQVAVVKAQVRVNSQVFHIFVNHFDSNPPPEQPDGFATLASGLARAIAIGDYNCRPGGRCLELIGGSLDHCAAAGPGPDIAQGKVDHIFVSADLTCPVYDYLDSDASDHPVVWAEIAW